MEWSVSGHFVVDLSLVSLHQIHDEAGYSAGIKVTKHLSLDNWEHSEKWTGHHKGINSMGSKTPDQKVPMSIISRVWILFEAVFGSWFCRATCNHGWVSGSSLSARAKTTVKAVNTSKISCSPKSFPSAGKVMALLSGISKEPSWWTASRKVRPVIDSIMLICFGNCVTLYRLAICLALCKSWWHNFCCGGRFTSPGGSSLHQRDPATPASLSEVCCPRKVSCWKIISKQLHHHSFGRRTFQPPLVSIFFSLT